MDLAGNILRTPIHVYRLCEGYCIHSFLADAWISQGICLGSLFTFIGFVSDSLEISLQIHGFCKEYH